MALLTMEGFEGGALDALFIDQGNLTASGRHGNGGEASSTSGNVARVEIPIPNGPSSGETLILGFAFYYAESSIGTGRRQGAIIGNGGSDIVEFRSSAGGLDFVCGGTTHAMPAATMSPSTWHYVELKIVFGDGTAGSIVCRVDGVEVINKPATDTIGTANFPVALLQFYSVSGNNNTRVDDIYVLDGTGTTMNDLLGDCEVRRLNPTGQGTHAQGTGSDGDAIDNYLLVDETDSDPADWVELENGDHESYTVPNLAAGEIPLGVRVAARVGDGPAEAVIDGTLRLGGVDYSAGDGKPGSGNAWRHWTWGVNPDTGVGFVEDDLDGVEIGVERTT